MGPFVAIRPAIAHTPGTWRLIYFDAPNRGEQVRQLFFLAGTVFTDVRVHPYPEGLDPYKKAAMGDDSPLCGTDLCPAVTAPDGTHCVETSEIMRFVGQRVGLAPAPNSAADAKAMEVCLAAQSCLDRVFYGLLRAMIVQRILGSELFGTLYWARGFLGGKVDMGPPTTALEETMQAAEAALVASGGPFVCGEALSYADVSLFAVLRECLEFRCFDSTALLGRHPKLSAMLGMLRERTQPWIDRRVRENQLGIPNTVDYFVATNTPFPWSRKTKTYSEKV